MDFINLLYGIILWLYVFGIFGILATVVAEQGGPITSIFKLTWVQPFSMISMLLWPITVPMFICLSLFDHYRNS